MSRKTRILFYCKHNSCRSQIAEALLRYMAGDRFEIHSAGLNPQPIHPFVYQVMEEAGIDISGQTSKSIDLYLGREPMGEIIIVCQEGEAECPQLHPFALHVERWPLPDPAGLTGEPELMLQAFRDTRDTIQVKLEGWLQEHNDSAEAEE